MYLQVDDQVASHLLCSPSQSLLSLSADMEKLFFLREETADMKFLFGDDVVVPAHKWVLATRVPYFERLFASGMREATTHEIPIEDSEAKPFVGMLRFIYCGQLLDDTPADSIIPLADKYGILELKEACALALTKILSKENAVKILYLADLHQCMKLRSFCITRLYEWNKSQ